MITSKNLSVYNAVMLRFLLALILAFTTLALPAQAVCRDQASMEMGCCCAAESVDCAEIGDTCCGFAEQVPVAPQSTSVTVEPSPMASSHGSVGGNTAIKRRHNVAYAVSRTKPVHLACNKLYLKKRSLLI